MKWSSLLAVAFTAVWLAQVRDFGVFEHGRTPVGLLYGLNVDALKPWQFVTYALVHTHGYHIFGNLVVLSVVSRAMEASTPRGTLPLVFFISLIIGALVQVLLGPLFYTVTASVGASGGIIGILCVSSAIALTPSNGIRMRHRLLVLIGVALQTQDDASGFLGHGFLPQIHAGGWLAGLILSFLYVRKPELASRWCELGNKLGYLMLSLSVIITITVLMRWI